MAFPWQVRGQAKSWARKEQGTVVTIIDRPEGSTVGPLPSLRIARALASRSNRAWEEGLGPVGWMVGSAVSPTPTGVTVLSVQSGGVMALVWV